ncbi:MAG: iron-sulfur cluster assembly accessory protein [Rickettsiaceae bacterium]|nr:iron-sulfur cluster assembly accessory protein [Rickettsiaceae bacterium]
MHKNLIVTDAAFAKIDALINQQNDKSILGLRISVEAGGCSGLQYKYQLTSTIFESDIVISKNDTKVFIDPKSIQFVEDSEVNFVEELGASYFEIKNPNAASKCGCGNSFGI